MTAGSREPVVVIGGGLSGLATGFALQRRGVPVRVLEAGPRVGGLLRSPLVDGFLLEDAANSFIDREPLTREVISSLGLSDRVRTASPESRRRFLFTRGGLHELPSAPPRFLRSAILPASAKARALLEPFSSRGRGGDESVASFFRRHLGARITATLVDAMQSGIYAGDPERLSLRAAFPRLAEMEREHRSLLLGMVRSRRGKPSATTGGMSGTTCSFDGGIAVLIEGLAGALGAAVEMNAPVSALTRGHGGGFEFLRGGVPESASRVVIAAPAYVASELTRSLAPSLSEELGRISYAPIAAVHFGWAPGVSAPRAAGFGVLVPEEEGLPVLGIIFVSSTFPFRAPAGATLITCLVGGARHPELLEADDGRMIQRTLGAVQRILGESAAPTLQRIQRWPRGIPQYEIGHVARVERIRSALSEIPGLSLAGNAYTGVGLHDCLRQAEEAAQSAA